MSDLHHVARALVAPGKGILAADESTSTIQKRFDKINVENTEAHRQAYRELLFTAPGIQKYISGVIMYDETIRQSTREGKKFVDVLNEHHIIPGIKVDLGTEPFNSSEIEHVTKGLEGLPDRLAEYYALGARFAKWRAVFAITDTLPSSDLIAQNAHDLSLYAKACQAVNIVPIVEPEVLMEGDHTIERCFVVTTQVLVEVFKALDKQQVDLKGMLLKPNMVIQGSEHIGEVDPSQVAEKTLECFYTVVPKEVPGIVFLSGGESEKLACETLEAISEHAHKAPWELSYSYGRALQNSALHAWAGKDENFQKGQEAFLHQAHLVSLARSGQYSEN